LARRSPWFSRQGLDPAVPRVSSPPSWARVESAPPSGPGEACKGNHETPTAIFRKAIERGNLVVAEVTALELGRLDLSDALELTALTALKDRPRSRRLAARWLERWLAETQAPTSDDAVMVAGLLVALGDELHDASLTALRGIRSQEGLVRSG